MRYVLAVAEHRNFGRAAASLGIRQPPLSQQIKALETELGVRLFIRSRDGSELTAAGEVFAKHARAALACAEAARTEAQRADRGDTGKLIIGFLPSAFDVLLPKILMAFTRRWPHVTLEPVAAAGFTPRVASRVQGVHTVIGLVAAGVGLGVVRGGAKGSARTDVSFVPLSPSVAAPPLALLWRSQDGRPLRRRFLAVTRDVLRLGADEMTARELDQVFLTAYASRPARWRP